MNCRKLPFSRAQFRRAAIKRFMIRALFCLTLALCPAALAAQDRDWPITGFDGFYGGFSPRFHAPAEPRFAPDGSVQRQRRDELTHDYGLFLMRPDGQLCLDYGEGASRCDVYLRDGQMRMLVTESGTRVPFRFELGVGN